MGHAASLFFSSNSEEQTLLRRVTPSDEQFDEQQERWNELAEYLRPVLGKQTGYSTRTWLQGSYKFGTQVRPVRTSEEFDIDLGFYFEWSGSPDDGDYEPQALRVFVRSALQQYVEQNDVATKVALPKTRCERIQYKGSFHIDVPVYHLNGRDQRRLATEENQWEESDPKRLYLWFARAFDDADRTKVRRAVRYLKAWAALKFQEIQNRPSSILLTVLVAEAALEIGADTLGQDDDAFAALIGQIHYRLQGSRVVLNPVNDAENFGSRLDDTQWSDFLEKLEALDDTAARASDAEDEATAADIWQEAFEYLMPMPIPDASNIVEAAHQLPALRFVPEVEVTAVARHNRNLRFQGRNGIGPIPKECDIAFKIVNGREMPFGAEVTWTVRNEGREAENTNDLGHRAGTGLVASEYSAYRGKHYMDCTVRVGGGVVAIRRIPVDISGMDPPRRNPVRRPDWVSFRR